VKDSLESAMVIGNCTKKAGWFVVLARLKLKYMRDQRYLAENSRLRKQFADESSLLLFSCIALFEAY